MGNVIEYKGYQAKIEFDAESCVLYGKIEGIRDLVNFEADSANEVEQAFHEAVDDYLEFCREVGKNPDKAYNGQFNVRISPKLHRELAMRAFRDRETLNREIQNAVEQYLKPQMSANPIVFIHPDVFRKGIFDSKESWWAQSQINMTSLWDNNKRVFV